MAAPSTTNTDTTITVTFSTVTTSPANGGLTVSSYSVDYKLSTDSVWTTSTGVTSSPQTLSGLTAGATYHVAVRAMNSIGYSGYTNYATVTMHNVPSTVQSLAVTETGDQTGVTISWSAPSSTNGASVTAYLVEI